MGVTRVSAPAFSGFDASGDTRDTLVHHLLADTSSTAAYLCAKDLY